MTTLKYLKTLIAIVLIVVSGTLIFVAIRVITDRKTVNTSTEKTSKNTSNRSIGNVESCSFYDKNNAKKLLDEEILDPKLVKTPGVDKKDTYTCGYVPAQKESTNAAVISVVKNTDPEKTMKMVFTENKEKIEKISPVTNVANLGNEAFYTSNKLYILINDGAIVIEVLGREIDRFASAQQIAIDILTKLNE